MPVRREGYRVEAESSPEAAPGIWRRALLDSHASIRELGRYWLRQAGGVDAASFYRQAIAQAGMSALGVCGLAECGDQSDLPVLRGLLVHPKPRIRWAAIRGIARIAKEEAVPDLVKSLTDHSTSVVREAKKQLQPFSHSVPAEALFAIVRDGETSFIRWVALALIFEKGKWQSLPWLIRVAFTGKDESTLARRYIEAWFSPPLCNRVFSRPSAKEREAIAHAIAEARLEPADEFVGRLQEWLDR
jgi:hypothetical protein